MSEKPKTQGGVHSRRVPVVVRSWDGPNSRLGLELDLNEIPWGPFDALGKRLSLLLPVPDESTPDYPRSESQLERALRHVEHAADRCAEFAQLSNGDQELWLRSQQTWEWIRRYLTSLWVETEVESDEGNPEAARATSPDSSNGSDSPEKDAPLPLLPGAASTLEVAARALRATPLAVWRETMGPLDPEAPTREEAVQTLLGLARVLGSRSGQGDDAQARETASPPPSPGEPDMLPSAEVRPPSKSDAESEREADPDQLSYDYARGYDEGYQMGRRVGVTLGIRKGASSDREKR